MQSSEYTARQKADLLAQYPSPYDMLTEQPPIEALVRRLTPQDRTVFERLMQTAAKRLDHDDLNSFELVLLNFLVQTALELEQVRLESHQPFKFAPP